MVRGLSSNPRKIAYYPVDETMRDWHKRPAKTKILIPATMLLEGDSNLPAKTCLIVFHQSILEATPDVLVKLFP